jgi:predicted Zn-dependent protease
MLMVRSPSPDLRRALDLINPIVERFPENVNYRDTRGRIHAKMGKWKEALADLETVLQHQRDNPELHRTLAEIYEHLGDPGMASVHRRHAEQKSQTPPGRKAG